jgi:hypothetical protein
MCRALASLTNVMNASSSGSLRFCWLDCCEFRTMLARGLKSMLGIVVERCLELRRLRCSNRREYLDEVALHMFAKISTKPLAGRVESGPERAARLIEPSLLRTCDHTTPAQMSSH